jgi:hypothetical protein
MTVATFLDRSDDASLVATAGPLQLKHQVYGRQRDRRTNGDIENGSEDSLVIAWPVITWERLPSASARPMAANSTRVVAAVVSVLGSVTLLFAAVLYSGYTLDHALHGDAIALGIESLFLAPLPLSLVVWTTRLTRKGGLFGGRLGAPPF